VFSDEQIQKRLLAALFCYEIIVIGVTAWAGANIALSGGGSLVMAAPLLLIAAAEGLRIFVAGWASRVGILPKILAGVVLFAISIASFEGLSIAFEQFVSNRTLNISARQRDYRGAQTRLAEAQAIADNARTEVARIDNAINNLRTNAPQQPALSGKTCAGKRGPATCASDLIAQKNFADATKAHTAEVNALRAERVVAQAAVAKSAEQVVAEQAIVSDEQDRLGRELLASPMHRLAATYFGVPVESLTLPQFEAVRRVAIGGLAGALAVLSATVSIVAHAQPTSNEPSKLSRALRAYLARRRKAVVRKVKVPSGVKIIHRYIPVSANSDDATLTARPQKATGIARIYPELFNAD